MLPRRVEVDDGIVEELSKTTKHFGNDISNQQDAAKFVLLILLSLLYIFRATVWPIFRGTLAVYTAFW
jgi:hypothetical protein